MRTVLGGPACATATILLLILPGAVTASGPSPQESAAQKTAFIPYAMDHGYFTCEIPAEWPLDRDAEEDAEFRIYEITLNGPAPMTRINIRYLLKDNPDFPGYENFLDRNSRNALGETRNARENYGPVTETRVAGTKAFELRRERMVYLHPETTSDESVGLKELLYVVPLRDGSFYVLHFETQTSFFAEFLPVFERIVASFKTLSQEKGKG